MAENDQGNKRGRMPRLHIGIPFVDNIVDGVADASGKALGFGAEQIGNTVGGAIGATTKPMREISGFLGLGGDSSTAQGLRQRGGELISLSQRLRVDGEGMHPSYQRIVDDLLPDEARILRFLGRAGTQPLLDVRTKTLFMIGSELLLADLSMVAEMAGCDRPEQDRAYFANLERLGLIELSDEPVEDYRRYALLEVQPAAVHAIESVKKAHTIFRSLRVTQFGSKFIDLAFDLDGYDAGGWADDGRNDKYIGKRGPYGTKLSS